MSDLSDFEADGLDGGAEAGVDPDQQPDPSAAEQAVAPEAPAWAPDRDEWNTIVQTNLQLQQMLAQATQQPEPEPLAFDPFAEDFGETLEQRLARLEQGLSETVNRAVAPIHAKQAEEQLNAWFAEEKVEKPEHQQAAAVIAQGLLPRDKDGRIVLRPGEDRQVLSRAVSFLNNILAAERKAGYEEYKQSLTGARQPDGGPAVNGAGTQIVEAPSSYDQIIARHAGTRTV